MEIAKTLLELTTVLNKLRCNGRKVALVPTMGALHKGHLSLIECAKKNAKIVVCSIFVNPTQFTDPKDLEKYPRPLQHDINMLIEGACDVLFMPSVLDIYPTYPASENWKIDLGRTEFLLEGAFRKGHYQGVTQVVKKLFDAVKPDVAFFGQKDYQQVLIIKKMVERFNLPIKIMVCSIIREPSGLAMSSRNVHLSEAEKEKALVLFQTLSKVKQNFNTQPIELLLKDAINQINNTKGVDLDYFTIANGDTLEPVEDKQHAKIVALVAAKVGQTRLIDNLILKDTQ